MKEITRNKCRLTLLDTDAVFGDLFQDRGPLDFFPGKTWTNGFGDTLICFFFSLEGTVQQSLFSDPRCPAVGSHQPQQLFCLSQAVAFGWNLHGQCDIPADHFYEDVACGENHTVPQANMVDSFSAWFLLYNVSTVFLRMVHQSMIFFSCL